MMVLLTDGAGFRGVVGGAPAAATDWLPLPPPRPQPDQHQAWDMGPRQLTSPPFSGTSLGKRFIDGWLEALVN